MSKECHGIDFDASPSANRRKPDGDREYQWCVKAFKDNDNHELLGLSFGVLTWDNWSKHLSNRYLKQERVALSQQ
eukprot:m.96950 g.96950  ORF g.96950 m.96950 type:complete len:75 (+) comp10191_c0_seq5:164-388(+)